MIRPDTVRSAMVTVAASMLAFACSTQAPAASPTPTAPAQPTPAVQPTATPASATALPTLTPPGPGTATIQTTGDVTTTITLPWDSDFGEFPTGDGEFDLRFQDDELNTLLVTLTIADGEITRSFVGVGVPGTSLADDDYYADFFGLSCEVDVTRLEAEAVEGTFECPGLANGADTRSIDARGAFSAVP